MAAPNSAVSASSTLATEIGARLDRVEEFRFLRQQAEAMGARVWLFGGTAAGFAHYVSWDLKRASGDVRYQPDRFDYDYTNIFRSNQDLDIVIDGSPEKAAELQRALAARYPHLKGSKTAWEVRTLRSSVGHKEALLDNPDFLNQHTDSNSTGMIELTSPPGGETRVRDLRDWKSQDPFFLRDVSDGKLHYYFSPQHATTARAKAGNNPPILSVIRYLTKAFQYELEIRREDWGPIRQIVSEFRPSEVPHGSYVASWIEKNAKKLVQNAINIDYAVRTLDEVGLREKLRSLGNPALQDSLAWWMSKEPLRDRPLGTRGRTAAEVFAQQGLPMDPEGRLVVAHETSSFMAYESITRAHTGDPNVLISRDGYVGEAASYGEGFYARAGQTGGRGTRIVIRFELDPRAREGADFTFAGDDYLVICNKRALKVIPESLDLGLVDYFRMLREGGELFSDNLGALEKLKRRILNRSQALSAGDEAALVELVSEEIRTYRLPAKIARSPVVSSWFELPVSARHPELIDLLAREGHAEEAALRATRKARLERWVEPISKVLASAPSAGDWVYREGHLSFIMGLFAHPDSFDHPEWLSAALKGRGDNPLLVSVGLTQQLGKERGPEAAAILSKLAKRIPGTIASLPVASEALGALGEVFDRAPWTGHPDIFYALLDRQSNSAQRLAGTPFWAGHRELLARAVREGNFLVLGALLRKPAWWKHSDLVRAALDWAEDPRRAPNERWSVLSAFADGARDPAAAEHFPLVLEMIEKHFHGQDVFGLFGAAQQPHWKGHPELIEAILPGFFEKPNLIRADLARILTLPQWREDPHLRRLVGDRDPTPERLYATLRSGFAVADLKAGGREEELRSAKTRCQVAYHRFGIGFARWWAISSYQATGAAVLSGAFGSYYFFAPSSPRNRAPDKNGVSK